MSLDIEETTGGKSTARKLPWDNEMEVVLLKSIILHKAHVPKAKSATKMWKKVNDHFFDQSCMEPFKSFKPDKPRKLKEKFDRIRQEVQVKLNERSNKSKYSGDMPELYRLVESIEKDMAAANALKEDKRSTKDKVDALSEKILEPPGRKPQPLKTKHIDGTITDKSDPAKKQKKNFEDNVFDFVKDVLGTGSGSAFEEVAERQMMAWIGAESKTLQDLAGNNAHHFEGSALSLELLVNMYCSRGLNFAAGPFKSALEEVGTPVIVRHIVYLELQKWRAAAAEWSLREEQVTPAPQVRSELTTGSVASNSSGAGSHIMHANAISGEGSDEENDDNDGDESIFGEDDESEVDV